LAMKTKGSIVDGRPRRIMILGLTLLGVALCGVGMFALNTPHPHSHPAAHDAGPKVAMNLRAKTKTFGEKLQQQLEEEDEDMNELAAKEQDDDNPHHDGGDGEVPLNEEGDGDVFAKKSPGSGAHLDDDGKAGTNAEPDATTADDDKGDDDVDPEGNDEKPIMSKKENIVVPFAELGDFGEGEGDSELAGKAGSVEVGTPETPDVFEKADDNVKFQDTGFHAVTFADTEDNIPKSLNPDTDSTVGHETISEAKIDIASEGHAMPSMADVRTAENEDRNAAGTEDNLDAR